MDKTIATAMCIDPDSVVDFFGRSKEPVAVYDAATITVLGKSDAPIARDASGRYELTFGGVKFIAMRHSPSSKWFVLRAVGAAS